MKVETDKELLKKLKPVVKSVWIEESWYNNTTYIAHIKFKNNARYLDRKFKSTNRKKSVEQMLEYLIDNNLLWKQ